MAIQSVPSPRDAVPSVTMPPPDIDFVESGWSASAQAPIIRISMQPFPMVTVPIPERIFLGPAVDDFGPAAVVPVDAAFKAYRVLSVPAVAGGLLDPVAAGSRRIRVSTLLSSL